MPQEKSIRLIAIMLDTEEIAHLITLNKTVKQTKRITELDLYLDSLEDIDDIKGYLNVFGDLLYNDSSRLTRFVIIYDATDPKKTEHIETCLDLIKKYQNDQSLFTLVSIGSDSEKPAIHILEQFSEYLVVKSNDKPVPDKIEGIAKSLWNDLVNNTIEELNFSYILNEKKLVFTDLLETIKRKAIQLHNDGHIDAASKADTLISNLKAHSDTYFLNPTKDAYDTFKMQTENDILEARDELEKHRGWKRVLGNIGLAICGFLVLYAIAVAINGDFFFKKTDSAKMLDKCDDLIRNDTFKIG